jgi:hypothetical protein
VVVSVGVGVVDGAVFVGFGTTGAGVVVVCFFGAGAGDLVCVGAGSCWLAGGAGGAAAAGAWVVLFAVEVPWCRWAAFVAALVGCVVTVETVAGSVAALAAACVAVAG